MFMDKTVFLAAPSSDKYKTTEGAEDTE